MAFKQILTIEHFLFDECWLFKRGLKSLLNDAKNLSLIPIELSFHVAEIHRRKKESS